MNHVQRKKHRCFKGWRAYKKVEYGFCFWSLEKRKELLYIIIRCSGLGAKHLQMSAFQGAFQVGSAYPLLTYFNFHHIFWGNKTHNHRVFIKHYIYDINFVYKEKTVKRFSYMVLVVEKVDEKLRLCFFPLSSVVVILSSSLFFHHSPKRVKIGRTKYNGRSRIKWVRYLIRFYSFLLFFSFFHSLALFLSLSHAV